MNTATVHGCRASKRPPLSDSPARALPRCDAQKKIFFSDNLRRRWSQIVLEGRA